MKKYVYSEANQAVVCGEFAGSGCSYNLGGGAISPLNGLGMEISATVSLYFRA